MALQPMSVREPWDGGRTGAIIVDTVTGIAWTIPWNRFADTDDAERFLQWLRAERPEDVLAALERWRGQAESIT